MNVNDRPPWWKPYQRQGWNRAVVRSHVEAWEATEHSDAVKAANSRQPQSYVWRAQQDLLTALDSLGDTTDWNENRELLDLYTLLVLTVGAHCTNEHVHDAWAVARQRSRPDHPDLVPYDQVDPSVQEYDTLFRRGVRLAALDFAARKAGAP